MRDLPEQHLIRLANLLQGYASYNLVMAAVKSGVIEALRDGPGTVDLICERAGTHPDSTRRFLELLVAYGLVKSSVGAFSLLPTGQILLKGQPGYSHAILIDREFARSWASLDSVLKDGKPVLEDPWRERSEDPELGSAFGEIFASAQIVNAGTLQHVARMSRFRTVGDIGGGVGMTLISLLERNKGMTGKVQDLAYLRPQALERMRRYRVEDRAEFVVRSVFDGVVEGMEAYVLQNVLQDWRDDDCKLIITRCREAMGPDAILFVMEHLRPAKPNTLTAVTDVHLMVTNGGRKRTGGEICELLRACGLTATVLENPSIGVVEARPA